MLARIFCDVQNTEGGEGRYRIVVDGPIVPEVAAYVSSIEDAVQYVWDNGGYMLGSGFTALGIRYREAYIPDVLTLDQLVVLDSISR